MSESAEHSGAAGTGRSAVRSYPQRARYDAESAYRILDDGRIGHLATTLDGFPHVVPMMYVRMGDQLHIHGRRGTPLVDHLHAGGPLAFAVTLVDGIVLAREVRFHSLNYRSLVIHGVGTPVTDAAQRSGSLSALAEKVWPGRSGIGPPTTEQLAVVELFAVPIEYFSVKTRTGPPTTRPEMADPTVWAGHVDLLTIPTAAHPDALTAAGVNSPDWPYPTPDLNSPQGDK